MAERMFDKDSFLDEVDTPEQAEMCIEYLALNEQKFRKELHDEGLTYAEVEKELETVWLNLIQSCKRVGYTDSILKIKEVRYTK